MSNSTDDLREDIDKLRTTINEMSIDLLNDETKNSDKILSISQELDMLIIKYYLSDKTKYT